ncbi:MULTISPECIES: hypothetical protein [Fischerella]|uniref:Lipoprotein n=1 Tax=Fischerella muscicola CCMEE 5323 TaxID=2019572 RepID=A0A2N6JZ28_FISMU|nr:MULTISPECIES: hypothetical protein [Fischerella]MBD2431409.1 hypothetical protein [Fischerella sp. FACHB-380]PLZ86517.1 hypothetical protein CEN44_19935 [Fischerella muscicola CCMEE 5323]
MSVGYRKNKIIVPISVSLTLLLIGCNDNKASQCQRLIKTVNDGNSLVEINKGTQVATSLKLAKDLQTATKKIEQLNLKDPKLKEYQTQFVKVFTTLSQNIYKAGKALNTAKLAKASTSGRQQIQTARSEIDNALKAAEVAAKQSDVLATQVNRYCSQPE